MDVLIGHRIGSVGLDARLRRVVLGRVRQRPRRESFLLFINNRREVDSSCGSCDLGLRLRFDWNRRLANGFRAYQSGKEEKHTRCRFSLYGYTGITVGSVKGRFVSSSAGIAGTHDTRSATVKRRALAYSAGFENSLSYFQQRQREHLIFLLFTEPSIPYVMARMLGSSGFPPSNSERHVLQMGMSLQTHEPPRPVPLDALFRKLRDGTFAETFVATTKNQLSSQIQ